MVDVSSDGVSADQGALRWVESMGGPLVVVPVSALEHWAGCSESWGEDGVHDDYDRACDIEGYAGVLGVGAGGAQALVLGDNPATSCFVPALRVFVRQFGGTAAELPAAAEAVLTDPTATWEDCGVWETDGDAVLMDSVTAGNAPAVEYPNGGGFPEQAPVPVPAGRWQVDATHQDTESVTITLVRLLPAS
ncbi:Imm21 family immunity protein [Yinghuangia sp. YIM S09857]|uniref:Imm21 family immunity protein n=1 Tax=Yinghuangia sp. YIM S09857 TaxID=3436929 RepID=UPI003F536F33